MSRLLLIVGVLALTAYERGPEAMPARAPTATEVLLITETGVGPITAATPFDRDALRRLFPGAEVTPVFVANPLSAIWVVGPGDRTITVLGKDGLLFSVSALGPAVRGPDGETTGATMSKLGFDRATCTPMAQDFLCRRAGTRNVSFVFISGEEPDPVLGGILWRADAP